MKRTQKKTVRGKTSRQGSGGRFLSLRRILVPVDFSEPSIDSLHYAERFARHFGAELILLHVVEPTIYPADFGFGQVGIPNFEDELRKHSEEELRRLSREVEGVPARSFVRTGKPFWEIVQAADKEKVDMIIIASHGHTGVEHILFGSTAEKVVRKAPCPVLAVRTAAKPVKSPTRE